jgi:hypothetical protein
MNERIKELAEQATVWFEKDDFQHYSPGAWNEKFAELIVRECMEIADTHQNRGDALSSPLIDGMIAKHFGVE